MTQFKQKIEIAEFVITDELITCCSHANNRHKMYLIDKENKAQESENARKNKALQKSLLQQRMGKRKLKVTAQKLAESAARKTKNLRRKQMLLQ